MLLCYYGGVLVIYIYFVFFLYNRIKKIKRKVDVKWTYLRSRT